MVVMMIFALGSSNCFFRTAVHGPAATWELTKAMLSGFRMLFSGKLHKDDVAGPVGLVKIVGQASDYGVAPYLMLLALVSLNLAFFNLLPIPGLDGGKIFFILLKIISGGRINDDMEYKATLVGMAVLIMLFVFITIFVVTGISNGANLNDGMDGMCAGNSAIIGVALGILAYVSSHIGYASYFDIMYIPHSEELVVFLCAFVGAMIGFLWYNAFPAQIFMGDTGSLTIGGLIGVCAVIIHKELQLPILCGIFFVENLSVIIQTQWFKIQKRKGKRVRVFRATPIHDTFRKLDSQLDATSTYILKGWPRRPFHESKITIRFWITSIILAALTIITLKMR